MNDFGLGTLLVRERLRNYGTLCVLLLSCSAVYALGVIERQRDAASAADSVLGGAVFGIAVPLLAYLLSDRVCAGTQLSLSVDVIARHGANRRKLVLGLLLGSALCMALSAALLTTAALLGARAAASSAFLPDLRTSVAISLLAGGVYALWFGMASLLGKRGGGRKCALIVDFLLGASSSVLALPLPRGHVRNLLGGTPVHELSQPSAWLALGVIGVSCLTLSALRSAE